MPLGRRWYPSFKSPQLHSPHGLRFFWVDCTSSLLWSPSLAPLLLSCGPFLSAADHPGVTRVSAGLWCDADVYAHAGRSVPWQRSGRRVEWEVGVHILKGFNSYLAHSFTSTFVSFQLRLFREKKNQREKDTSVNWVCQIIPMYVSSSFQMTSECFWMKCPLFVHIAE